MNDWSHVVDLAQFVAIGAFWWAILNSNRKERDRIIKWRERTNARLDNLEGK